MTFLRALIFGLVGAALIMLSSYLINVQGTHEVHVPGFSPFAPLSCAPWPLLLGVLVLVFLSRRKGGDPVERENPPSPRRKASRRPAATSKPKSVKKTRKKTGET